MIPVRRYIRRQPKKDQSWLMEIPDPIIDFELLERQIAVFKAVHGFPPEETLEEIMEGELLRPGALKVVSSSGEERPLSEETKRALAERIASIQAEAARRAVAEITKDYEPLTPPEKRKMCLLHASDLQFRLKTVDADLHRMRSERRKDARLRQIRDLIRKYEECRTSHTFI